MSTEKPIADRVKETVAVLKKLEGLGIPLESSGVIALRERFNEYIKNGTCWYGTISFAAYGRICDVELPRSAKRPVAITLRVNNGTK